MPLNLKNKYKLLNEYEEVQYKKGLNNILGIDEVGRGPIAGDVVVAGVVLNKNEPIYGLDDSKKLTQKKREALYLEIQQKAKVYKLISISNQRIDEIGISNAIREGVAKVVEEIEKEVEINYILIDYMKVDLAYEHLILKKGDQKSNSIAAASILAKVYRDNKMIELAQEYPEYGFETHKGYGTKKHIEAVNNYGVLEKIHRKSFEPIKSIVKKGNND